MENSKIQIKVGHVEIFVEGTAEWVSTQITDLYKKVPELLAIVPAVTNGSTSPNATFVGAAVSNNSIGKKPLGTYLQETGVSTKQVSKFLATAVWLHAKGANRVSTAEVAQALKDSNQKRLGNPADCLNQNVTKGYCEKDGKQFYVTDEGRSSLVLKLVS